MECLEQENLITWKLMVLSPSTYLLAQGPLVLVDEI